MGDRWTIQDWTTGDLNALVKNLGEDVARSIKRGGVEVSVEEVVNKLFDKNGRRIPQGLESAVCDADRTFYLDQPMFEFGALAEAFQRHFPRELEFSSAVELEDRGMATIEWIKSEEQLANIVKGPHFILGFPLMPVNDYGEVLEEVFLPAVGSSYMTQFPQRKFINYRKGELKRQVDVVEKSHNQLHLLMPEQKVVVVWFPCLQGFSIDAQREQMATLPNPERIWLSGTLEASMGIVGYPGVMARDYNTPGLDQAANSWQSADHSLYFRAFDDGLNFGGRSDLARTYGDDSGGLLFLG